MNKRYQVFVSSTYADLKEERSKVIQTIMELDCIPAGMELFPAIDEEQFEFIKKVIDDCDYYILIIGGRYGSLSEDGISYTEKEYDYAIDKGIRVMAFIHSSPDEIPLGKSEKDNVLREKLEVFRQKVSKGRLVKFWTKAEELPGIVALSLPKTIKTYPAIGWVRANIVASPEVFKEMNDLRKENQELKDLVSQKSINEKAEEKNLAGFEDAIKISGRQGFYTSRGPIDNSDWSVSVSWKKIFSLIAPHLLVPQYDGNVKKHFSSLLYNESQYYRSNAASYSINDQDFQTLKIQFMSLGVVEVINDKKVNVLLWSLTKLGEKMLMELRSVKKE